MATPNNVIATLLKLVSPFFPMPLCYLFFWSHAFATAIYLINHMPTPTLNLSSPYEKIFSTSPNYSKLLVFSYLCYPWLRPYSSHKLDSGSEPCVFLGYFLTQNAYFCLDPCTSKIFVSRHVKFVKSVFPFASLKSHLLLV